MIDDTYVKRVESLVEVMPNLCRLESSEVIEIITASRAMHLDGHFELLSQNHTDTFFQFLRIASDPDLLDKIVQEMVEWVKTKHLQVDVVLGPTSAGMVLVNGIAENLNGGNGPRSVYAKVDTETGRIEDRLEPGFHIEPNEHVLVVNDLSTTATGMRTLANIARNAGKLTGVCLFAVRPPETMETLREICGTLHVIVQLNLKHWKKKDCKLCEERGLTYSRSLTGVGPLVLSGVAESRWIGTSWLALSLVPRRLLS